MANKSSLKRKLALECALIDSDLTRISDVLDELVKTDKLLAELVDLKFFCGLTFAEIASLRSISERTVQRQWEKVRIYLHGNIRANLEI